MSLNLFAFLLSIFFDYGESNFISLLSGLSRSNPVLAISLALCLLSMAGIPPLAGFFSKYFIFLSLIEHHFYLLSLIAIILSVIGSFYYIRIIQISYFKDSSDFLLKDLSSIFSFSSSPSPRDSIASSHHPVAFIPSILLGISLFFILTFMFFPNPLILYIQDMFLSSLL